MEKGVGQLEEMRMFPLSLLVFVGGSGRAEPRTAPAGLGLGFRSIQQRSSRQPYTRTSTD